ncbi:hypothetical protein V8F06_006446, partial [Rhypophila decipiens]
MDTDIICICGLMLIAILYLAQGIHAILYMRFVIFPLRIVMYPIVSKRQSIYTGQESWTMVILFALSAAAEKKRM